MKCPNCNVNLSITERQGVEIDYCPECRGVWLDRGELDKIIDRGSATAPATTPRPAPAPEYRDRHDYHKKHKRESFLGELFDF